MYTMAEKQALVGVCFSALNKLPLEQTTNLPKVLKRQWLGMTVQIQQRNEMLDERCKELSERYRKAGFRSCVLKGQGVANLYGSLKNFRQPGDIDLWVEGDRDVVVDWARKQGVKVSYVDSVHAHADFYDDTEVEVHSRPSWMYNRKHDKVFIQFWKYRQDEQFTNINEELGFCYPTVVFNLVYSMLHINRHIFEEGIGLRQLLDYYFILKNSTKEEREEAIRVLKTMNLKGFASGVMYIEQKVLGLGEEWLIAKPDAKEGEFLLKDILIGGNFGRFDERNVSTRLDERWKRGWYTILRSLRYAIHYPSEVFSIPIWKIRHLLWRKKRGYI